jgi:hypothetical protein
LQPGSKDLLIGLLMVDRPYPADPEWLQRVEQVFGECQLVPMTATGERGIACQMKIEPESQAYLHRFPLSKAAAIKTALVPLLDDLPAPAFALRWNESQRLWESRILHPNELPEEVRQVFETSGCGCLAADSSIGVVHVCHASDRDIEGFANKSVRSRWQLIKMPTAPLIRLELVILDQPGNPYRFESFLNIAEDDQVEILARLANQEQLYLAFYGDGLDHCFTKVIPHNRQQWQFLDELVMEAQDYWSQIPLEERNFDRAKAEYMRRSGE